MRYHYSQPAISMRICYQTMMHCSCRVSRQQGMWRNDALIHVQEKKYLLPHKIHQYLL